jgi:hypothetical protein
MEKLTEKEWIILMLGVIGSSIMSKYLQFNLFDLSSDPAINDVLNIILIGIITFFILLLIFEVAKSIIPPPKKRYYYLSPSELNQIDWYAKRWSNIKTN